MGAHICGSAGREFYIKTGFLLIRITGFDPASNFLQVYCILKSFILHWYHLICFSDPCFNTGGALTGLFRGDGTLVDIIHSDPGALGKKDAMGDIDFFPNGFYPLQPGCFDIVCSHGRSYVYFAETVYPGQERNFLAVRCTSITALNANLCRGASIPMGYKVPTNVKGNFFLRTNSKSPYGLNATLNFHPICVS